MRNFKFKKMIPTIPINLINQNIAKKVSLTDSTDKKPNPSSNTIDSTMSGNAPLN